MSDMTPEMFEQLPSTRIRRLQEKNAALEARLAEVEAENAIIKQMWWDANDVTDLAETIADLESKLAKAMGALTAIDILDPEEFVHGCSQPALAGLVLRMGKTARDARTTIAELRKD